MDPNATLAWLLAFATRYADGCPDHPTPDGDGCAHADDLADVAERIHALDGWLRRGGHPPTAWTPAAP